MLGEPAGDARGGDFFHGFRPGIWSALLRRAAKRPGRWRVADEESVAGWHVLLVGRSATVEDHQIVGAITSVPFIVLRFEVARTLGDDLGHLARRLVVEKGAQRLVGPAHDQDARLADHA